MKWTSKFQALFYIPLFVAGCTEPFEPEGLTSTPTFVVDGLLTNEFKNHEISFSQTSDIDSLQFMPITGANLQIFVEGGAPIALTESSPGRYLTPIMAGTVGTVYRLVASTQDGVMIESEPVTMKATPGIDAIDASFVDDEDTRGIDIRITSEAQSQETLYLRWSYEETYEYVSVLPFLFDWLGGSQVQIRDIGDSDTCYVDDTSSDILLFSGINQTVQRASNELIRFLPEFSDELQNQYSINVRQYALSEAGHTYWGLLQELNSSQGTTFDIQPGRVIGNLSGTDGPVLGFFDAAEVQTRRIIFRTNDFIIDGLQRDQVRLLTCVQEMDTVAVNDIGVYMTNFGDQYNIAGALAGFGVVTSYITAPKPCTDCRLFGTNVKPIFWP